MLVVATAIFLLLSKRRRTALFVLLATLGGGLVSVLLKAGFGRPRPDLVPHSTFVYSTSFPSGHVQGIGSQAENDGSSNQLNLFDS